MPRIFLPVSNEGGSINISGEKARYLIKVLRCQKGDHIEVFDGKGRAFRCLIRDITKKGVTAEVIDIQPCNTESPLNLILLQGLLKGEKMDMVIQKTTELGIKEIFPVITERSQLRDTGKVIRWRKIAEDASRQSGRSIIPVIHEPIGYRPVLDMICSMDWNSIPASQDMIKGLIFYEGGGLPLKDAVQRLVSRTSVFILIGPEGGFTRDEVQMAEKVGFLSVSIGRRIMRAETAAIVSIALVEFLMCEE